MIYIINLFNSIPITEAINPYLTLIIVVLLITKSITVTPHTQKVHLFATNEKQFNFIIGHSMVINDQIAYIKRKVGYRCFMDSFAFDDMMTADTVSRRSRAKPEKRKWREIEALKDRQRLRRELQDMDMCGSFKSDDFDF